MSLWKMAVRGRCAVLAIAATIAFSVTLTTGLAAAKVQVLTQESVKQFIASYPDVRSIAVSEGTKKGTDIASAPDTLMAVIEAVSDKAIAGQIDSAVRAHGFKDAREWASVAQSVGRAYAHLKVGPAGGKAQKKLDKAIAKIEKNDFLNDKQKQKLVKALRDGTDAVLEEPPADNVAAVKPMVAELEAVVK